jgi:hypothetical protein
LPPYSALAGELILGNKAVNQCGGLAQGISRHSGAREARTRNPEQCAELDSGFARRDAPEMTRKS